MRSLAEEFGINVKNARLKKGLTQQKLAEECDLDRSTIWHIESGKSNITLLTIGVIAKVLGVHPSDLLKTD